MGNIYNRMLDVKFFCTVFYILCNSVITVVYLLNVETLQILLVYLQGKAMIRLMYLWVASSSL